MRIVPAWTSRRKALTTDGIKTAARMRTTTINTTPNSGLLSIRVFFLASRGPNFTDGQKPNRWSGKRHSAVSLDPPSEQKVLPPSGWANRNVLQDPTGRAIEQPGHRD